MLKIFSLCTVGFLTLSLARAEDYPDVKVIGHSADAQYVATLESVITDGKGDVLMDLKIFGPDGSQVWDLGTREECTDSVCEAEARKEILVMGAEKLKHYGIDDSQLGQVLFSHTRQLGEGDQRRNNYQMTKDLKFAIENNIKVGLSIGQMEETESTYWELKASIYRKDVDLSETQKHYLHFEKKPEPNTDDDPHVAPNVGFQKVVLIKTKAKTRLLILSSHQSVGFEGPNTEFLYNFVEL